MNSLFGTSQLYNKYLIIIQKYFSKNLYNTIKINNNIVTDYVLTWNLSEIQVFQVFINTCTGQTITFINSKFVYIFLT